MNNFRLVVRRFATVGHRAVYVRYALYNRADSSLRDKSHVVTHSFQSCRCYVLNNSYRVPIGGSARPPAPIHSPPPPESNAPGSGHSSTHTD